MQGRTPYAPWWVKTLLLADKWGKMPEEIEERASSLWVERWEALRETQMEEQSKPQVSRLQVGQSELLPNGSRRTRVV